MSNPIKEAYRELLHKNRFSQLEAAKALCERIPNCSVSSAKRILNGQTAPRIHKFIALMKIFNVTIGERRYLEDLYIIHFKGKD